MTELPNGWVRRTLGEVATWGSGGTPQAGNPRYYGGQIPWAVIGDLTDSNVFTTEKHITEEGLANSSAKLVPAGAILIAMYGSIGKMGIAQVPMTTNQAIAFALPKSDLMDAKYLFWYLRSQRDVFLASGKGATQQNISQTLLKSWEIPVPPLDEQKRIVEALDEQLSRLDKALADLLHSEGLLSAMKRSVFEKFGQSIQGSAEFPILDLCDVYQPRTIAVKDLVPNGMFPVYGANGQIGFYNEYNHEDSEVTITCRGATCGTVNVIPEKSWITGNAMVVRPKTDQLSKDFLELYLRGLDYRKVITGTAQPQITRQSIASLTLTLPPVPDQEKAVFHSQKVLARLSELASLHVDGFRDIEVLRRAALHSAFEGKLVT